MEMTAKEQFLSTKLIAIVRGVEPHAQEQLAEALYAGGIRLLEITFDQRGRCPAEETAETIHRLAQRMEGRMAVGAGTVLTKEQVQLAHQAGAQYILSPDTNPAIIAETKRLQMLSFPGALTPSEVQCAYASGADFVKLFPAGSLGAEYIRAILAPLAHIPVLAVGGVDETTIPAYLDAGVCGFGVGSTLVRRDWIAQGRFPELTALAEQYTKAIGDWTYVHSH